MHVLVASLYLFAPGAGADRYAQTSAALEQARDSVRPGDGGAASIAALERAISEAVDQQVLLADHPDLRALLDDARLRLGWLYLATGQLAQAERLMDTALREGLSSPPVGLGPQLRALHDQRQAALEGQGRATIAVQCTVPCEVVIDGRASRLTSAPLLLGDHHLWIGAAAGHDLPPISSRVALTSAGATVEFGPEPSPAHGEPPQAPVPEPPDPDPREDSALPDALEPAEPPSATADPSALEPATPDPPKRRWWPTRSPRRRTATGRGWGRTWGYVGGLVTGALVVGAGAALAAIDGKCKRDLDDPTTGENACTEVFRVSAAVAPMIVVGSVAIAGFSVGIGIESLQRGRRPISTALKWTIAF